MLWLAAAAPSSLHLVREASALLERDDAPAALALLGELDSPAAWLVRARGLRVGDKLDEAERALRYVPSAPELLPLAAVERGLIALARRDFTLASAWLVPWIDLEHPAAAPAIEPLAEALKTSDPLRFLSHRQLFEKALARRGTDARSHFLTWLAAAHEALGQKEEELAALKRRYLEEPVSPLTPKAPPPVPLTAAELLARAEVLQAAHRSERVIAELTAIDEASLTMAQRCQQTFGLGLALRKLRKYVKAEEQLTKAVELCRDDEDRARRARYLGAKVVSIRSGLAAIPLIDDFARRYDGHSMVDDVLFWAGDLYQRRSQNHRARAYFSRAASVASNEEYCAEARFRLGWMRYRAQDLGAAKTELVAMLEGACPLARFDRARGHYWLGRIAEDGGDERGASARYQEAMTHDGLGFYAQLALARLRKLDPKTAATMADTTKLVAAPAPAPSACARDFWLEPLPKEARALLAHGLAADARRVLLMISPTDITRDPCTKERLLSLSLALDEAGAHQQAHWLLRTELQDELAAFPEAATLPLWRAAYPLAFADELEAAEREHNLPRYFLQALAREESAFDAEVVSWAGAYGLTQLLLSTARHAGGLLRPKVKVSRAEELLRPLLNARLGGAFLASLLARYGGNKALALAAYNAGSDVADVWRKRHEKDGLDVLAEEITIEETRGYVKRVLRTFGVYHALYRGELPAL